MKTELHLITNFTNEILLNKIQEQLNLKQMDVNIFASDFDQILQYLEKLPQKSITNRFFVVLTRAENFDEDYSVKESNLARETLAERYQEFLFSVKEITNNIEGSFYMTDLFQLGESLFFLANNQQGKVSKNELTKEIFKKNFSKTDKIIFFDVQALINVIGIEKSWNKNQDLLYRQPLTIKLATEIATQITERIRNSTFTGIKMIATDADGTLWGGIIGENEVNEIEIGQDYPGNIFSRYQKFLIDKKEEGILLALVTKNNAIDVTNFFSSRSEMPIKLNDFSVIEASWDSKSLALKRISKLVNISLDSILFIDDSKFEILEVNSNSPEIPTLHLDELLENRIEQIGNLKIKWTTGSTFEDINRTAMIQQNHERNELLKIYDPKDFIKNLELELEILHIQSSQNKWITRVTQLINKTNQFNMTCQRFTENEVVDFLNEGKIYAGFLRDKYGDYGLIAVALIDFPKPNYARIVNLLVSCRALGRTIEDAFLEKISINLNNQDIHTLQALWRENPKNIQTRDFYSKIGFNESGNRLKDREIIFETDIQNLKFEENYVNVKVIEP
jgi:FkbH-like protein